MRKSTLALMVATMVIFTGCATEGNAREESSQAQAAVAQADAPMAAAVTQDIKDPYNDPIKIAYVAHDISTPVNQAWLEGIEQEVAPYDNISVQSFNGDSSAENQVKIMTEVIGQEFDAIIIQASDGAALAATTKEAEEKGIPVITLNLDANTVHSALVQMIDYDAGVFVAEEIAESLGGQGNVVLIQGIAGVSRTDNIEQGFRDTLAANYPNIEIVASQAADFEKEKATTVMSSFLSQYDDIGGVFAINDAMAAGASLAAQNAGRLDEMVIWGADGERDALQMIEDGTLTGTIYTNVWEQGQTAAKVALLMIGSEYHYSVLSETPKVMMEPIIVTKDTVSTIPANERW